MLMGVGGLTTVGVAGAIGMATFGGNCGPGEDAIEDLEENQEETVVLKGNVVKRDRYQSTFTIDDGTGTAATYSRTELPDKGDCVFVQGEVSQCIGEGCEENHHYIDPSIWEQA